MEREILFRGKRIDNKEWVFGDFLQYQNHTVIHTYENGCRVAHEVDWTTIGQYTGLTDKNGVKIFEGDILASHYDNEYPDNTSIEVVEWFRNAWHLRQGEYYPVLLEEDGALLDSEVIGNIHENPKLLEEET